MVANDGLRQLISFSFLHLKAEYGSITVQFEPTRAGVASNFNFAGIAEPSQCDFPHGRAIDPGETHNLGQSRLSIPGCKTLHTVANTFTLDSRCKRYNVGVLS
jgi:hypothetical protein